LFTNLSWNDINAICPSGVCVDGGVLNGYAMTGWTWASIDEVSALFNSFLIATGLSGEDLLGPGVDSYQETGSVWATDFFGSDWLPTLTNLPALQIICGWTSELHRDEVTEGLIQWSPGSAISDLVATGNIFTDDSLNYSDESVGAWFFRTLPDGGGDGVPDETDYCPADANADQLNTDLADDGGDACDDDNDLICDDNIDVTGVCIAGPARGDNCKSIPNNDQLDANEDGCGDVCNTAGCFGVVCANH
jgi:hypothetical protein